MCRFYAVLLTLLCPLILARAQDTNALKTQIGLFEAQTGVVIIKGFSQIGSVSTGEAVVSVNCKETTSAANGRKYDGIAVEFEIAQGRARAIVDYDELNSILGSMDYLGKVAANVTPLSSFEASYTTKSGLQFIVFSNTLQGGILMFVQYDDGPRIPLSSDQWAQLKNLINQAKTTLDGLKKPK